MARSEVPPRRHGLGSRAELNRHLRICGQKIRGNVDDRGLRRSDAKVVQKRRGDPFIHEYPAMLRIIAKFDDVEIAVRGFEQMRLRTAAHFSNQAAGVNWHRNLGMFKGSSEERAESSTLKII